MSMNYYILKCRIFLLVVFSVALWSCGGDDGGGDVPEDPFHYNDYYICYRPYKENDGTKTFQRYMNNGNQTRISKTDWRELNCDCLVPVNYNQGNGDIIVRKGLHPNDKKDNGEDFKEVTEIPNQDFTYLTSVKMLKAYEEFYGAVNSPSETTFLQYCFKEPDDALVYYNSSLGNNSSPITFEDLKDANYDACVGGSSGGYKCPATLKFPFGVSNLPNTSYPKNSNFKPVLQSNNTLQGFNNNDFVFSTSQDYGNNTSDKMVRYVHVKIASKGLLNPAKTRVVLVNLDIKNNPGAYGNPGNEEQSVTFDNTAPKQPEELVLCTQDMRIVKFKIPSWSREKYKLYLLNLDVLDNNSPYGFKVLAENEFSVKASDTYVDQLSSLNYYSERRSLKINILSVPTLTDELRQAKVGNCGSLQESLEDAFTLDPKENISIPATQSANRKDFDFTIKYCIGASKFFDNNGNLKLNKGIYENAYDHSSETGKEGKVNEAMMEAFNTVLKLIAESYLSSCNSADIWVPGDEIVAFYANGVVLCDDSYTVVEPDGNRGTLIEINKQLPMGYTGPAGGVQDASVKKASVITAFKNRLEETLAADGPTETTTGQAALIALAHEIGHAWAQPTMVYTGGAQNATTAHNTYCGGINKDEVYLDTGKMKKQRKNGTCIVKLG